MAAGQDFAAQVSAFVAQTHARQTAVFREASERVIEAMQKPVGAGGNMPILTGFLRASLQVTKDAPTPATQDNPDPSGTFAYSSDTVSLAILGAEIGENLFATYSASYASAVCYGRNGKPGRMFVQLAAQQWPMIVAATCRDLQSRIEGSGGSTPST